MYYCSTSGTEKIRLRSVCLKTRHTKHKRQIAMRGLAGWPPLSLVGFCFSATLVRFLITAGLPVQARKLSEVVRGLSLLFCCRSRAWIDLRCEGINGCLRSRPAMIVRAGLDLCYPNVLPVDNCRHPFAVDHCTTVRCWHHIIYATAAGQIAEKEKMRVLWAGVPKNICWCTGHRCSSLLFVCKCCEVMPCSRTKAFSALVRHGHGKKYWERSITFYLSCSSGTKFVISSTSLREIETTSAI